MSYGTLSKCCFSNHRNWAVADTVP